MDKIVSTESSSNTYEIQTNGTTKLRTTEKIVFGVGDFGANYSWTFIASFIIIYMTDVVGIAGSVIGTIILICRFADGFSDVFMGSIIDNTNTKMGKAKPWIFWTAPILGVLTFMLFNVPDFIGYSGKVAYIFIIYFLISVIFYTANNVAYSSLVSFMTNDEKDRVSLGSIRFIFSNISVLCITTFTTFFVMNFGEHQQGWTYTSAIYGLLCAVPLMITGYFVKERNVANKQYKDVKEKKRIPFILIIKSLITEKYFLITIVLYLLWYLRQTDNGMRIYYATYIFHDPNIMAILSISTLLPTILGLLIAPKFSEKVGIKNSIIIGLIISIISYVVMSVFSESLPFLIIGLIINGIGIVPFTAALSGIVADVGDIIYWKTGVPVQGSIFSLASAGMKIGSGLQSAIVGWSLSLGGYVAGASVQTEGTILAIKAMQIYFPLLMVVSIGILTLFLNYEQFIKKIKEQILTNNVGEMRTKQIYK
ncbi:glycoside-pentoside-hexuronide (GPH):cation symporter [Staphylococcus gallinarum]|jgi:GPH family glycoside/pentoside/hexuronide:cation symporter|uniref:MFS transporter n=1 Tax=Staphylococcus TaxID=1279 RepID=UPI000D1FAD5E|nr:glycoside-pentoside-hexuronide (GPH):cation symporter [Staphylococcus gallinarum]MCD8820561.1 glycoside-pentoside-hexuronide (GPH):cation symporter [Staphylococcus gallinarum]MCD8844069.1 glycoside-pentoside-hexuronide (GPH):cation symporter [Staphylococcus gallinarum]PTK91178.1 MFS transporter [Staphylococcus gallinarum]PTL12317.1 MFS transporter [Staphylococcus gallinarum]RIL35135.1 MFS transporter [Staphylococcus gallinarum]